MQHQKNVAQRHIIIVGAGAVGLSTARAALLRGDRVTIIEQNTVPNPHGASFDQHRMIRFQYGAALGYTRMVHQAFAAWDRLWRDLGEQHYYRTGALGVSTNSNDYIAASVPSLQRADVAFEWLDHAEMEKRVPQLKLPKAVHGLYTEEGGVLFADRIVTGLSTWIRARGAVIHENARAVQVEVARARVRLEGGTTIQGDALVVAAGAWLPTLELDDAVAVRLNQSSLPVRRQAVCYVEPPAQYAAAWANGPCLTDIGEGDNYALMPVNGTGLKFGSGAHRRAGAPRDGFIADPEEGHEVIGHFAPYLHRADEYVPQRMAVGYYVKDASERFNVQRFGDGIVVTNCDGQMFKFSALMGERIMECLDGELDARDLSAWAAGS
ncbi:MULTISPECIES: FAD-dependent oxidoreductase [unclassified Caballeronia]|uniref:NAD(P)/FAD-dependent oxidoreductase n=1 Tax=unclassified Caballeronia TaxID=2646786 RepID=UPI00285B9611|nr:MULTISPECIES: FAD-dependent oxidoreductase [unclassified Caballeronia]MDR5777464.1 FAD-dependent oxidoreductase [Caballeronia sp. LZ002]MDR5852935.1 FAD-dependent oxidoreductase [Caballeronia sp. LZ003]